LLGGDGLLAGFDDPGMFDLFTNLPTSQEDNTLSPLEPLDQHMPSNYNSHHSTFTIPTIQSFTNQPQLKKHHILSTGSAFVTETPAIMVPRSKSLPYTVSNSTASYGTTNTTDSRFSNNSPNHHLHHLASYGTNNNNNNNNVVVKSSSSKSHKKQKTTFMREEEGHFTGRAATVSSEYFLGDVPVVSNVLPIFNSVMMPITTIPMMLPKKHPFTKLPITLFQAFNAGDMTKVKELITENTLLSCTLRTPSLSQELIGSNYVIAFFQAVYDAHPDAILVAKKYKFIPSQHLIEGKIYFAGTRIMKSSLLMNEIQGNDINSLLYDNYDYLFKRKGASLLDEMNVMMLSDPEIAAMKELENSGKNLSVFWKGNMIFHLTNEGNKIDQVIIDWKVTSFREAGL